MKRIGYFILAAVLLMGCEDFLDQEPLTQKTSANFPQSEEDAKQMMAGIYTTMNNAQRFPAPSYFFINEVASDDKLGGGGLNDLEAQAVENFMTSNPEMMAHTWSQKYEGIHRANYALESLEAMDQEILSQDQINQYKGEALFLRAWFYYQLATMFGEVPLKTSTEPANLPNASPSELYGQIASDLKNAIETMPNDAYDQIQDGRATRWAAEALMARVYLFYTGFYNQDALPLPGEGRVNKQDVINWLQDCIDNSGHHLVDDFHELWPYTNSVSLEDTAKWGFDHVKEYMKETGKELTYASENGSRNPESMFMIKFSTFADWGVPRGYGNMYQLFFGLRGMQPVEKTFPYAGGWGQGGSVPASLVEQWKEDEPDDPRLWASVIDIEKELMKQEYRDTDDDGEIDTVQVEYKRGQWDFVMESNYWGRKIQGVAAFAGEDEGFKNDYSVIQFGNSDNNQLSHIDDLIYIRYADVLLMMSELTEDPQYMNEVRARAGLDPVSEVTTENIRKERRYEFACEGIRWNDMRRYGDAYAIEHLQDQVGVPIYNFGKPATHEPLSDKGYDGRYNETRGFFPIPQQQIGLSEGTLEQVDGYKNGNGLYTGW